MDMIKEINQNPERYSTKLDRYQISATSSIKPLDLPFGDLPEGLMPVLEVDGIIVNVNEYKLVSQKTLDLIKESNNPHYDIKMNGEVKTTSNKIGTIGQTIPSITLNVDNLISVGTNRDILNRVAGVTDVNYVYEGSVVIEGTLLTQNLIDQINYTLNKDIDRPEDEYTLAELKLSDIKNYDITGLTLATAQTDDTIFNNDKLKEFLIGIKERIKALNLDFNIIKDIHYKGVIPPDFPTYVVKKMATAEDLQEDGDFDIVTKTSELISVEKTPAQKLQEEQQLAAKKLQTQLEESISTQQQALAGAQAADNRTQQYIQQQLEATRNQLASTSAALQSVQKSLQK
jgi:hypothetical protein